MDEKKFNAADLLPEYKDGGINSPIGEQGFFLIGLVPALTINPHDDS
jgi:hypothetical protein